MRIKVYQVGVYIVYFYHSTPITQKDTFLRHFPCICMQFSSFFFNPQPRKCLKFIIQKDSFFSMRPRVVFCIIYSPDIELNKNQKLNILSPKCTFCPRYCFKFLLDTVFSWGSSSQLTIFAGIIWIKRHLQL